MTFWTTLPNHLFVATHNGVVVGTVALQKRSDSGTRFFFSAAWMSTINDVTKKLVLPKRPNDQMKTLVDIT